MKYNLLMVLTIISSLSMTPVLADSSEEAAPGSTSGDEATTNANKKTLGAVGSTRDADAGKAKPAGTGTAAGYIFDQAKKGNIKIEGATDADFDE